MKINSIVLIILSTIVFYILLTKKENMSNTDIKKIISEIYQADIQSIRNLSKLANDLTNNGKLVVPGGLEIKGNVKINGDSYVSGNSDIAKNMTVNRKLNVKDDATIGAAYIGYYGKTNKNFAVFTHKNMTTTQNYAFMQHSAGTTYINTPASKTLNLRVNNSTKMSINGSGDAVFSGNGYFGPAYIGKYLKTDSNYAQFCHKNLASNQKYALLQHKNGNDTYLNTGKHIWFRQNNATKMDLTHGYLSLKEGAQFGTKSKRPLKIVPSTYRNEVTYLAFFRGSRRTGFFMKK